MPCLVILPLWLIPVQYWQVLGLLYCGCDPCVSLGILAQPRMSLMNLSFFNVIITSLFVNGLMALVLSCIGQYLEMISFIGGWPPLYVVIKISEVSPFFTVGGSGVTSLNFLRQISSPLLWSSWDNPIQESKNTFLFQIWLSNAINYGLWWASKLLNGVWSPSDSLGVQSHTSDTYAYLWA